MGREQTFKVVLTAEERAYLIKNTKGGDWSPREVKRAQILLKADKNNDAKEDHEISEELRCSQFTVQKLRERFAKERLGVIHDKERSGRPKIIDGDVEAHVIAIVCSTPPAGRERWTMQLIADRVVQLTDLESCSEFAVRQILKKTNSSLGRKKNGKFHPKQMKNLSGEWKKS
jgi:transposase